MSRSLAGEYVWATLDLSTARLVLSHRRSEKAKAHVVKISRYPIAERVEPGQPEELARGPAWPRTPARAQNALLVLSRPSARCLRLPIRTAAPRAFTVILPIAQRDAF